MRARITEDGESMQDPVSLYPFQNETAIFSAIMNISNIVFGRCPQGGRCHATKCNLFMY
jgi:hypothetical protein